MLRAGSKQILVVEDDQSISEMLIEFLTDEGYQVIHAASAMEALKMLSDKQFHLITLDMSLPGMDGNEFLGQLDPARFSIPVIVVSANHNRLVPTPQVKAVIPKPFDLYDLSTTIQLLLN